MSQKLEVQQRQAPDATETQSRGGPHFALSGDSVDSFDSQAQCVSNQAQYVSNQLRANDQPQCASTRFPLRDPATTDTFENETDNVLITVLMPCLNEARTLAACIQQAHAGCQTALSARTISRHALASGCTSRQCDDEQSSTVPTPEYTYEILIADNGSTDGSPDIATASGARVVHVAQKGYGSALRGGIAAARGKYIVMGDSDCSYDFGEVPRFLDKLEEGYDLVMGNRFAGGIMPGAMPWHHRYIGNPVLSGIGRLLYRTPCRDWHCGLRAFDREKLLALGITSPGMEFASEMVIRASKQGLAISEIPITLSPDGRKRPPHLRSFRDGFRHLMILISNSIPCNLAMVAVSLFCAIGIAVKYIWNRSTNSRSDTISNSKSYAINTVRTAIPNVRQSNNYSVSDVSDIEEISRRLVIDGSLSLSDILHLSHLDKNQLVSCSDGKSYRPIELLTNTSVPPYYRYTLERTTFGARFPLFSELGAGADQSNSESHRGQALVGLAALGVDRSTVLIKANPRVTVNDLVTDICAHYSLNGEIYWETLALILYRQDQSNWSNKFGKCYSLDEIAIELMSRDVSESPCAGTHGLIVLATLSQIDRREGVLSSDVCKRLDSYLASYVSQLLASQLPDGGWDRNWNKSDRPQREHVNLVQSLDDDVVLSTGHHLEWLVLLPLDDQPDNEVYYNCVRRLLRILQFRTLDKDWVRRNYCPVIHAARAVSQLVHRE